ncbi:serine hydrolase domain-containing protein [Streptomyces salinarius]|uniref:serine hydrolase domain-containing protein n=1 Tax=Streptomyces salinarius TaxID=2762598 RepID=UPI00164464E4|nr:serine hydrolase domain-containing protein [Streptomyces salinarius]
MIKHKRALGGALAVTVAIGIVAGALPAGAATAAPTARPTAAQPATTAQLRALMHRLTTADGAPGALLRTRDRHGTRVLTSGVADIDSHAPVARDSRFRIGSMTKPFVATVVLQLVGEHHVALDAPVTRYLPDLFRGHDNDDRKITVRQLLQHTSGLPDYLDVLNPAEILKDPLAHHDARDLVNLALAKPRTFEPGEGWRYSNTNYVIAGMLIEKVTGNPYGEEISRRIIKPLGLSQTSVPGDATAITGPHPRGYVRPGEGAPLTDLTELNPSIAGASGEMISSADDLNRFLGALVGGRLLRPAQLRAMMQTHPTGDNGREYGLGLERKELARCDGVYWGHGGDIFGYQTAGGATLHGRQATVMANVDPGGTDAQDDDMEAAVQTALCEGRTGRQAH